MMEGVPYGSAHRIVLLRLPTCPPSIMKLSLEIMVSNTRGVALSQEFIAPLGRYRIVADNHFIDYKVGGSQIIIALFVF